MRLRIVAVAVAVASSLAVLVGWMFSGIVDAQNTESDVDPACHYEVYGPPGADYWTWSDGTIRGPVILLNQCTGTSWQLARSSQSSARWHRISVSRN